jgi:hypothetical protein
MPRAVFKFQRIRFHFEAAGTLQFAPGESANAIRGALGAFLLRREHAEAYRHWFEPPGPKGTPKGTSHGGAAPSGFRFPPRPFVLRAAHLDGSEFYPGQPFFFDLNLFELRAQAVPHFRLAFEIIAAEEGLGSERVRARLTAVEALDLEGHTASEEFRCAVSLEPEPVSIHAVTLQFVTPTEVKAAGRVVDAPQFRDLYGRIRDRISTLGALYGSGPPALDLRALGQRAGAVEMVRSDLTWEYASRKSSRTGQIHPLGGFTGAIEYRGELSEFVPWLRAAQWTGVGRQTVWGKGEIRLTDT